MGSAGWIVLGLVTVLARWLVATYNRLLRQRCRRAFSDIDVQLKRATISCPTWWRRSKATRGTNAGTLEAVIAGAQATT
jgi:LemA protein